MTAAGRCLVVDGMTRVGGGPVRCSDVEECRVCHPVRVVKLTRVSDVAVECSTCSEPAILGMAAGVMVLVWACPSCGATNKWRDPDWWAK